MGGAKLSGHFVSARTAHLSLAGDAQGGISSADIDEPDGVAQYGGARNGRRDGRGGHSRPG